VDACVHAMLWATPLNDLVVSFTIDQEIIMVRLAIVRGLCLGLLCGTVSLAPAQDFSADVYNVNGKNSTKSGKVYVKGAKMRIDRGETSPEQSIPLLLIDGDTHTATIVDAPNHAYMKAEVSPEQGLSFSRTKDPNYACAELEKMVVMSGCKKAGNESVGGRQTVKYTGKSDDGKAIAMWVDPEVNFVVKWLTKSGEIGEMRDIKVAPQADSLFALPPGFHNAVKSAEGDEEKPDTKGDSNKEEPPAPKEEPQAAPQ
jgi:hypothetical protein